MRIGSDSINICRFDFTLLTSTLVMENALAMKSAKILSILFSILLLSCNKYKCESNCSELLLKGFVVDQTSGKGFRDMEVRAVWSNYLQNLPSFISKTKTNSNGAFEMRIRIIQGRFSSSALAIQIECPSGYAASYNYFTNSSTAKLIFGQPDQFLLQNIRFRLYPKTIASLRLVRSQPTTFGNFFVEYSFGPNEEVRNLAINKPNENFSPDTIINIGTSPDIFTKFKTVKNLPNGQVVIQVDSAIFSKTGSNAFLINY